jgi:hypothetical protein
MYFTRKNKIKRSRKPRNKTRKSRVYNKRRSNKRRLNKNFRKGGGSDSDFLKFNYLQPALPGVQCNYIDIPNSTDIIIKCNKIKNELVNKTDLFGDLLINKYGWFNKEIYGPTDRGCFNLQSRLLYPGDEGEFDSLLTELQMLVAPEKYANNIPIINENQTINDDYPPQISIHFARVRKGKAQESSFVMHQDNVAFPYPVATLVIYLDIDCIDGNLIVYQNQDEHGEQETINVRSDTPEATRIIMFAGDVWHKPQPIKGYPDKDGVRIVIVYNIMLDNYNEPSRGGQTSINGQVCEINPVKQEQKEEEKAAQKLLLTSA